MLIARQSLFKMYIKNCDARDWTHRCFLPNKRIRLMLSMLLPSTNNKWVKTTQPPPTHTYSHIERTLLSLCWRIHVIFDICYVKMYVLFEVDITSIDQCKVWSRTDNLAVIKTIKTISNAFIRIQWNIFVPNSKTDS